MRKSSRLVFVLSTGVTAVIVWLLLLYPEFLATDKRTPPVKELAVFRKERTPIVRKQPTKVMSPDEYLMRRGFSIQEVENMSPLGRWLLTPEGSAPPRSNAANRSYLILIWKHGRFLERRHIRRFTSTKFSPWEQCTVQNCALSYDEKDLHLADAAVFHLHLTKSPSELPARNRTDQRWIFLTDESPYHTFLHGNQKLSDYDGMFNWSMSYRMDSDVPVPYGRTVEIAAGDVSSNDIERWDVTVKTSKTKLVAVMGSNCGSRNARWIYVKELKSLLRDQLDILGNCLNGNRTVCPGHFARDCDALAKYKFYLSFENSNCREYMTEKVFWNAYA
ncbi:alpha-(1,3)-fucosyltransferase 7-like [Pseudomyrmex gracilis]|uniref:alpha-(1,3)-fucosyltransferase 7-like n=1 Tax=Pseudomyrmex gracilis TaxID=219809 RepID=UPI0009955644|nr:alpha-(1,3)-fucosyltransferase 7-like [Pseudomyrmex gracilis]